MGTGGSGVAVLREVAPGEMGSTYLYEIVDEGEGGKVFFSLFL